MQAIRGRADSVPCSTPSSCKAADYAGAVASDNAVDISDTAANAEEAYPGEVRFVVLTL